ncbi:MAG: HlyC/CorC family transporter [Gammaproteobacteria bacterium]|nr:HlyC/CorC family transporter [Gammaproteobacteria bacterium]
MDAIPIASLFAILAGLIILSAFFSSSETALMALNRYRLKHRVSEGHHGAILANNLLKRPDRLIGLILLGNNAVNILASAIATIIGYRLYQEPGIAIATGVLTILILIFAEVAPKTVAALYPERIAYPASYILTPLLKLLSVLVQLINFITNGLLKLIGVSAQGPHSHVLSQEELRTVVLEAGKLIPDAHQKMLLSILDLEKATVEDIMIPKNEIHGIDIDDDWDQIHEQLINSQHTRLPVYRETIDQIIGFIHLRKLIPALEDKTLNRENLQDHVRPPYFIPKDTSLNKQILSFQNEKRRLALAIDEYGDIQGLVTLEDILEEIVGEFTSDPTAAHQDIFPQADGSYLVNASITVRELKRSFDWDLPTDGPKTLNGLVLEHMEDIPQSGTSLMLYGYPVEIMQTQQNAIKTVKLRVTTAASENRKNQ